MEWFYYKNYLYKIINIYIYIMTISKIDPIKDFECNKGRISENKPSQIQLKL